MNGRVGMKMRVRKGEHCAGLTGWVGECMLSECDRGELPGRNRGTCRM